MASVGTSSDAPDYTRFARELSNALPSSSAYVPSGGSSLRAQIDSITPNDIVIAVMGVTGSGKSTFVSHFCNKAKVGDGLRSCTEAVEPYLCESYVPSYGQRLILVDTPGFDDSGSGKSDTDILSDIAVFLNSTYKNKVLLTGIIYLHRISDNRVGGSGLRQMNMFRKLCGQRSMANLVIATTMWSLASPTDAVKREQELMDGDGFFKQMIRNGTKLMRQNSGTESAIEIIRYLVRVKTKTVLDIQSEMVDGNKRLDQTGAGQVVEAELAKLRKKHEKELVVLKQEMKDAINQKDGELAKELDRVKKDVEDRLAREQESSRRLQQSHNDLMQRMSNEHREESRRLQELLQTQQQNQNSLTQRLTSELSDLKADLKSERSDRSKLERKINSLENANAETCYTGHCRGCGAYGEWTGRPSGLSNTTCWRCGRRNWW